MTDAVGSTFLYILVGARSHSGSPQTLPAGWEWAGEACRRYGSRWSRCEVLVLLRKRSHAKATDCGCVVSDAWRCASKRRLTNSVSCPCACHRERAS